MNDWILITPDSQKSGASESGSLYLSSRHQAALCAEAILTRSSQGGVSRVACNSRGFFGWALWNTTTTWIIVATHHKRSATTQLATHSVCLPHPTVGTEDGIRLH